MKSELDELYQQVILDHNKNPRNFGTLEPYSHFAKGHNPLCGDKIDIYLEIQDGIIKDVSFSGSGCAISKASSSIMTTLLKGKKVEEAKELFEKFHHVVTCPPDEELDIDQLGKLAVFAGVREFPARVKCASLAWHTMATALDNPEINVVSTE